MNYKILRGVEAVRDVPMESSCTNKKKYRLKEARQTANSLKRMGQFKHARIYECGDHWHIARQRYFTES